MLLLVSTYSSNVLLILKTHEYRLWHVLNLVINRNKRQDAIPLNNITNGEKRGKTTKQPNQLIKIMNFTIKLNKLVEIIIFTHNVITHHLMFILNKFTYFNI
ncbi:hypothetical protein B4923_04710 [Brenneria roseae subsp. americana]|uniref:Uncharacterized protein n=1 Tax=Brenneria roseae subsp. americana TaxID=1508507 RepID=A0A2U1TXV8_9GAMM|nr:hypothetical protein B4923_04710 [Brenneria roseae subsp. americana]